MQIADECDDHQDPILCAPSSSSCDEDRMKRREFIAATAALLVSPGRSWAILRTTAKMWAGM